MSFDEIWKRLNKRFSFDVCLATKEGRYYIASALEGYVSVMAFSTPLYSELPLFGGNIVSQTTTYNGCSLFTPSFDTPINALAWFLFVSGMDSCRGTEDREIYVSDRICKALLSW
ncbi:hypothetical protein DRO59_02215 [Candidatus Bathyarchaeota archaeon]|nr:MAG: hypothetical protein DRO59_02215 [Candidatus Bathyarchaeota archaeon]